MMDLMNSLGMNASLAIKPEKDGVPGHVVTIVENPDGTYNVFDATTGTSQKNISAAELAKQGYTIRMTSEGAEYDMVTGKPTNAAVGNTEGVATPTSAQYNSTAAGVDIATIWTTVATDNSALVGATAKAVTITMSDGTTVQGYYVTDKSGKNYLLVDSSGNGKFEASECVSTSITPSAASVNGTNGTSSTVDVQAIFDNEMKKNAFTPRAGNDLATVAYNIGQKLDQIYKSMMGLTASTELFGGGSSMSPGTTMMLSMLMENCKSGIAALSAAGKACNDVGVKGMSSFADALR